MDIAVIKKAISGDSEAFEKLYQITHDKGFSVAYSVLKDSYEAEDVLQDSYIKMYEKLESLQNPAQFESWFYTIIRNKALDYLRSAKKDSQTDLFSERESDDKPDYVFEDTLVSDYREFNPEENIDYSETKRILSEIVDGLPEMQRQCIILRFQRDMKISEIAERLDMPESTVKSNLNYGKKKIEAEVKALEKQGIRLYSVTPLLIIPFLRWMWGNRVPVQLTEAAMEMANATQFAGSSSMGGSSSSFGGSSSMSSGSAANASSVSRASVPKGSHLKPSGGSHVAAGKHTAVVGKAAVAKGAVAATGTAAKTGGTILAAKIMAAVAAVSLIGGVAVMTVDKSNKDTIVGTPDAAYVQAEITESNSAQQSSLPVTDKVILTKELLQGDWIISEYTDTYNHDSPLGVFGPSYMNSSINFGTNGEFSYSLGASVGGVGSYQFTDEQVTYTVTRNDNGLQESSTIQLETISGVPYLFQEIHIQTEYVSGPYYIYWSLRPTPDAEATANFNLTEEFLEGTWTIDSLINSYNTSSLRQTFGSMVSLSAPIMTFGENREFLYYLSWAGGTGSYEIIDGQISYTITDQNGGHSESSNIQLAIIDGVPRLIQPFYFGDPTQDEYAFVYYLVWSR